MGFPSLSWAAAPALRDTQLEFVTEKTVRVGTLVPHLSLLSRPDLFRAFFSRYAPAGVAVSDLNLTPVDSSNQMKLTFRARSWAGPFQIAATFRAKVSARAVPCGSEFLLDLTAAEEPIPSSISLVVLRVCKPSGGEPDAVTLSLYMKKGSDFGIIVGPKAREVLALQLNALVFAAHETVRTMAVEVEPPVAANSGVTAEASGDAAW